MRTEAFPLRINVEVTNRCNQRCRLCPRDRFTRPLGLMDPALFAGLAEEAAAHGAALWMHFLGEPLLHPELVPMVRRAKAAGVATLGLSTNATLLDDEAVDDLLGSGLDRLDCSLDADDPDEYAAMRGVDHFARATANVRRLLAAKARWRGPVPVVSLQFVRTPALDAALPAIVERWRPLLGPDDFVKTIVAAPFHDTIAEGDRPAALERRGPCPWLFTSLVVHQDGTVAMCGADWDGQAPLGHLAEAPLAAIWTGPEAERRRRAHLEGRFDDVALCGDCTDWHLADGHGYANALAPGAASHGPVAVALRRR